MMTLKLMVLINIINLEIGQSLDEDYNDPTVELINQDGDIIIGYVDTLPFELNTSESRAITEPEDKTGSQNRSTKPKYKTRIQNRLAFEAAITNSSFWPKGLKVGYLIHSQSQSLDEDTNHLDKIIGLLSTYPKLVAIIGFRSSVAVMQTASFVSAIKVPSFTFSNGMPIDELLTVKNTDYMTRITSTKRRQINETIPSIIDRLGVNIVSIVYGPGKEAEFSEMTKIFDLRKNRVDVEFHLYYDESEDSKSVLKENLVLLGSDTEKRRGHAKTGRSRMHTIVLLLKGHSLQNLLEDFTNRTEYPKPLSDIVFLTDSSGCILGTDEFLPVIKMLTADNNCYIFRLCQTYFEAPEVTQYIKDYKLYSKSNEGEIQSSSKALDGWFQMSMGQEPCVLGESDGCKSVADLCLEYDQHASRYNSRIYYTVWKILKSLEDITKEQVTEVTTRNFRELVIDGSSVGDMIRRSFLENSVPLPEDTTFLRYSNGVMEDDYEIIFEAKGLLSHHHDMPTDSDKRNNTAVWTSGADNQSFIDFMEYVKSYISDKTERYLSCSLQCNQGSKTVLDRRFLNCWTCVPCMGNTYTSNGSWMSCKECDSNTTYLWANENRTACDQPAGSVNLKTTTGKVIWVIVCMNICILIFTVGVYIKYWKSRVIISSGRDLSSTMFIGILVGHIEALFIAMEPSNQICTTIHILAHVFMMLTVCPLLVKTFRIWLVFKFSVTFGKKIKDYITTWITISECALLILPQLIFLIIGLFLNDSKFVTNYVEESLDTAIVVTKSCGPKNFTVMLASIVYTGVLLFLSTLLGWDCRKLPDNFKESMHIFLSSLISLLLITVYVPAMLTMAGFTQVSLLAGVISIISVTLNLVIFIPKVYIVLFVSTIKQKQMFRSTHKTSSEHSEIQVKRNGEEGV